MIQKILLLFIFIFTSICAESQNSKSKTNRIAIAVTSVKQTKNDINNISEKEKKVSNTKINNETMERKKSVHVSEILIYTENLSTNNNTKKSIVIESEKETLTEKKVKEYTLIAVPIKN